MTGTFATRLTTGLAHEARVTRALRARGWSAEAFGQGQLTAEMRERLHETDTAIRWMPDIIASRRVGGRALVVLVDAKGGDGHRRTGRHAVECAALDAADEWVRLAGDRVPFYYVFSDGGVATPAHVRDVGMPGRYCGNGSGTPFVLVPCHECWSFVSVFGQSTCDS